MAQRAPTFIPGATALAGAPGTTTDARVAAAMQQAQQANQAVTSQPPAASPAGAGPQVGAPPMPQGAAPNMPVPPPATAPQTIPNAGAVPPQPSVPPMAITPPPPSGTSFQTLLFIGAGVMVLILLIAILSQKKKS